MVMKGDPPSVTGISPAEGPPGTDVKIRGENLGKSAADVLGVFICNVNCTYNAEWKSSKLIHCRTGMGLALGEIIVLTQSGGKGGSLVKFRGFMPRVGLLTEAAVWVDESKLFEEKSKTTTSTYATYTPSLVHTDPLGVAPEETGAILSPEKIEEWYPNMSSNPLSENFHPTRFLLERHLDTSFDALKSGYYHLQSKDTRTSVGPSSFVRGNLTTILDSLHTLNEVERMMSADDQSSVGGNICEELHGVVRSCDLASSSLFKDILSRKDEADRKRNVLNILQRFRFLFNLQRSIERNIQQGEYEILISDYNRARALFQNTQVKSFQKALSEVDKKIAVFSKQLKQKLFDFPTPLEEQKRIIRHLNELDYPGNAGLECISKQALWIKSLLLDCQLEHQKQNPQDGKREVRRDKSFKKVHVRTNSDAFNPKMPKAVPEMLRRMHSVPIQAKPPDIKMVEELCELVANHLCDFWNLGQTYLSNQLGDKKTTKDKTKAEQENFEGIVTDVITVFCEMVQTVLQIEAKETLSLGKNSLLVPWLPEAAHTVKSTLDKLSKLGLTSLILTPLSQLSDGLIAKCITQVLSIAVQERKMEFCDENDPVINFIHKYYEESKYDVNALSEDECWELEDFEESYCISKLPGKFEKIFTQSVQFVHDFLQDSKINAKSSSLHEHIVSLLKSMLEGYILALERTIFPVTGGSTETLNDSVDGIIEEMPKQNEQVLIALSNCDYSRDTLMQRIIHYTTKSGYQEISHIKEEISLAFKKLDERLFDKYMGLTTVVQSIEHGMFVADFSYETNRPVTGVRRYIKEMFMSLTTVHHQVSTVSSAFVKRVFIQLIERICAELLRLLSTCAAKRFSPSGALQGRLELHCTEDVFQNYLTVQARNYLKDAYDLLPSLESEQKITFEDLHGKCLDTMRYQLAIFGLPEDKVPEDKGLRRLTGNSKSPKKPDLEEPLQKWQPVIEQKHVSKPLNRKEIKKREPVANADDINKQQTKTLAPTPPRQIQTPPRHAQTQPRQVPTPPRSLPKQGHSPYSSSPAPLGESPGNKKTKRKAPAPPSQKLASSSGGKSNNPFEDSGGEEDGGKNPFLDDADEQEATLDSTNPFLDD